MTQPLMNDDEDLLKLGHVEGWSQSGDLQTGDKVSAVTMQADFDNPGTYTIEFNRISNNVDDQGQQNDVAIRCEALVTWSVEGNSVTRRISVGNGAKISGVGQAVRVRINDVTDRRGSAVGPVAYTVSCQVARGIRGANSLPPVLNLGLPDGNDPAHIIKNAIRLNQNSSITVPIPQDAGGISLQISAVGVAVGTGVFTPITEGDLIVTQQDAAGGQTQSMYPVTQSTMGLFIPIVVGTVKVNIFNTTGGPSAPTGSVAQNMIISTSVGIDG